jgi:hypothetical protein
MNTRLLAACALALLGAHSLAAQTTKPVRRWAVSISRSMSFGQSTSGVEQAVRAGEFDDQSCFFSCVDHPFSLGSGGNGLLTVRHALRPRLQIVGVYGTSHLGETFGYKADTGAFAFGDNLWVVQSVRVAGVLAGVSTAGGASWLAAGPAFFEPHFDEGTFPPVQLQENRRLGAAIAAGISTRRRFFIEAQGQYRLVGNVDFSALDIRDMSGNVVGSLPRTSVNFNHAILSAGVGVRW